MIPTSEQTAEEMREQIIRNCTHRWIETYYGYECSICKMFYAYGYAPWEDEFTPIESNNAEEDAK